MSFVFPSLRPALLQRALVLTLWVLAAPLCLAASGAADGDGAALRGMLLGILSYVRWPREPQTLELCVLGESEYAEDLLRRGSLLQANGRRVEVRRAQVDDPALGERCNVLYLGLLDEAQRQRAFAGVAGHPVLSLSEHDPDCSVGSVFCLDFSATPPSFAVNLDSVAHSGVRVHPNVLNLGRRRGQP
ncbi:YfiR family protein [Pseudomonas citronellolis]|uniref:YfiR family protein n=1 Tax=Pseudomonas citronellolis TaxID=53408 RepID=UPI000853C1F0|nr:YfiR family protein [Pseudomonas humi]